MRNVAVIAKDVQTGKVFYFSQITECACFFKVSECTVTNRIKSGVLTQRKWLFEYEDKKRQAQVKKKAAMCRSGEKVYAEKVPSAMIQWKKAAKDLGISPERLYAIIKKKGIKGYLYVDDTTFYPRRYYKRKDLEEIKAEIELKHNAALKAIIAFNENVNAGRIYHFTNIYICRCILKKKFGIDIPIETMHKLLKDGNEYKGWYIDEEA
ncbi:MAG: hypothetical protein II516_08475 [Treponema sp.]|nr:hypothetical protein [Treponema sp.]